ncbi:hypothetical protein ANN_05001 [Periplaneta americana]|uniref:Uncharacterized protein n=1 Tax=Periplaneta americana TaxID=6978 RepID=A0ABQ8TAR3_PERAM|nr:hypothetical protein ANN_05001 [Periplaneta americana]
MPRFSSSVFRKVKRSIINNTKKKRVCVQEKVRAVPSLNVEGQQSRSSIKIGEGIELQNNVDESKLNRV